MQTGVNTVVTVFGGPQSPRDLVDFHLRWAEFRPLAVNLRSRTQLDLDQRELLGWLIALADRVGAADI